MAELVRLPESQAQDTSCICLPPQGSGGCKGGEEPLSHNPPGPPNLSRSEAASYPLSILGPKSLSLLPNLFFSLISPPTLSITSSLLKTTISTV